MLSESTHPQFAAVSIGPVAPRGQDCNVDLSVIDVRSALIRQWELIAEAVPGIDLSAASRVSGWRNREVLAHHYVQPYLVVQFLHLDPTQSRRSDLPRISGTKAYKDLIDASAHEGDCGCLIRTLRRSPFYDARGGTRVGSTLRGPFPGGGRAGWALVLLARPSPTHQRKLLTHPLGERRR